MWIIIAMVIHIVMPSQSQDQCVGSEAVFQRSLFGAQETARTARTPIESLEESLRQPVGFQDLYLKRVFEFDVLSCPSCGGKMRVLCAINSQPAIQKVLVCLGLPSRAPPIAPAKAEVEEGLFG
jgi:hypothetical protein